jgi:glycosyltransferase involved in cell wall biosynthesis
MRLLALVTDAFGGQGGIAKFNRDMLTALCRWPGVEEVVALPRLQTQPNGRLPERLTYLAASAGGKVKYSRVLLSCLARDRQFLGVVCGHLHLLPLAAFAAQATGSPLVLVVHGIEAWQRPRGRLAGRLVGCADAFVAVSEFTKGRFLAWTGLDPSRGHVIPNCIDLNGFGPGPKREDLVRRYGLKGRRVILTLGRLSASERYKGHDEILAVLADVARDMPEIVYLVVGDGNDRGRLEARAAALGVSDRVVFAGSVTDSEKADHYRLADLFAMPGRGEGFGIVYLEALACGVPVLASTADASRETVRDGAWGRLVDPSDLNQIRRAILSALLEPRPQTAPAGLDYYTFERFEERWLRLGARLFPSLATSAPMAQFDSPAHA